MDQSNSEELFNLIRKAQEQLRDIDDTSSYIDMAKVQEMTRRAAEQQQQSPSGGNPFAGGTYDPGVGFDMQEMLDRMSNNQADFEELLGKINSGAMFGGGSSNAASAGSGAGAKSGTGTANEAAGSSAGTANKTSGSKRGGDVIDLDEDDYEVID